MLPARIAVRPLGDARDAEIGDAEIGEHAARRIELALPAIDQHEIGPGCTSAIVSSRPPFAMLP